MYPRKSQFGVQTKHFSARSDRSTDATYIGSLGTLSALSCSYEQDYKQPTAKTAAVECRQTIILHSHSSGAVGDCDG